MMTTTYFMIKSKIPERVILPGSRRFTLISKCPDTTSVQIVGHINFTLDVEQHRPQPENNLIIIIIISYAWQNQPSRRSNSHHSQPSQHHHRHASEALKKQLARIWQLKATYITPLVLSTMGIIADYTKVSNYLIPPCSACSKAYYMSYSHKVTGRTVNKKWSEWSERFVLFREPAKLLCSKECGFDNIINNKLIILILFIAFGSSIMTDTTFSLTPGCRNDSHFAIKYMYSWQILNIH